MILTRSLTSEIFGPCIEASNIRDPAHDAHSLFRYGLQETPRNILDALSVPKYVHGRQLVCTALPVSRLLLGLLSSGRLHASSRVESSPIIDGLTSEG